jgi:uncharacterized protein YbjT (DUF2867 family)
MIAILGATGKVGSKTAAELLARGREVKVIGRNAEKLEVLTRQGAIAAVGDILDPAFLSEAFDTADAVMLVIPQNMQAADVKAFQQKAGEAQIRAVMNANIKNIVFISSLGITGTDSGSVVAELGKQEERLQALPDEVNVIALRPAGFMENLFNQIPVIKQRNVMGSPVRADMKNGIIATQDIAMVAADKLYHLDFKGKSSMNLLGNKDYSQKDIASIIGEAIGKPNLTYVEFSYEENKNTLMRYGVSESVADAMIIMWKNINDGLSFVERTPGSTTPTTLEYFARHVFKPAFER